MANPPPKTVLVLGAYGLIGCGIVAEMHAAGHVVIAHGRNAQTLARTYPTLAHRLADLREPDFGTLLAGVDAVVNCTGVLQDGPRDSLHTIHTYFVTNLAQECASRGLELVQISACGATPDASTAFLRSKAAGDAAIANAGGTWWIMRPGLVLAPECYGGTLLLRMLAAMPLCQPLALPDSPIQTVAVEDVAKAVTMALSGTVPSGQRFDLVAENPLPLGKLITLHRAWLGFPAARFNVPLPRWCLFPVAKLADLLGRLGWRAPLRSTALKVLAGGVRGDPAAWRAQTGAPLADARQTLTGYQASAAHRLQARMMLLMPICVAVLAVFWLGSGVIGIATAQNAAGVLRAAGWADSFALASVLFWSGVDIALGALVLWRRTAQRACIGMALVSLAYLGLASIFTPALWADPLGPLLKILPAIMLPLATYSLLEER